MDSIKPRKVVLRTSFTVSQVLSFIYLLVLITISVRYCDLHDYRAYYLSYATDRKMAIEVGYTALANLSYKLGFPFYVFYGMLVSTAVILLWRFFNTYGKSPFLLMFIFTLYPYINCLQQIRSFIGAAIVLMGIKFLLDDEEKTIPYIAITVAAMLFHISSFVYLIFIYAVKSSYERIRRITTILFFTVVPLLSFLRIATNYIFPLIPYFSKKYMKYIYGGSLVTWSSLADWTIFFVILISTSLATRKDYYSFSIRTQKMIKMSYLIYCLTLLRGLGNNGYRIALMVYPVFYVMMENVIYETKNKISKALMKSCLFVFPLISLIIWWGPINPNHMFEIVQTEMWQVWDYYY